MSSHQIVNKSFSRRLLKQLHKARIRPYHLHDTLWLLCLLPSSASRTGELSSTATRTTRILPPSGDTEIYSGVDGECNPASPSQYAAIDVEEVYRQSRDEVRRVLRTDPLSEHSAEGPPPPGLRDFIRTVEQSKLLWLLRRLVNINEHPQRVPSASAAGVCRSIFSTRSGVDTFPLASMFLPRDGDKQQEPNGSLHENSPSRGTVATAGALTGASASTLRLAAANLPTKATIHSEHFDVTLEARHYEPKFVPHPSAVEEDGSPPQATEHRFLITVDLTQQRTSCMRAVVVNSYVCALDLHTQILSEVVGSLVNQADVPLLSKSEALREKMDHAPSAARTASVDDASRRHSTIPRLRTALDASPAAGTTSVSAVELTTSSGGSASSARDERKDIWQTTWIVGTDSNGPVVMRGTLHIKVAVCEDNASQDTIAAALAAAPIQVFAFGPILLRCTL